MPDSQTTIPDSPAAAKSAPFRLTVLRRLSQTAMLLLLGQWSFYGIFRCPFLVPYISCRDCPVVTCHGRLFSMFWGFWLLLPVSAILFGRAFCGWACPGGFVSQLLGKAAPFKLRVRNILMRWAPAGLYLGLAATLAAWFVYGQFRANVPIRVGGFFESVGLTFEHSGALWLVRTFIVIGLLAAGFIAANAWCRFACPTGSLLDLIRRISFFGFHKTSACNGCNACLKACEMGTRPGEVNCTNCADCIDVCPVDAIRFGKKKAS